MVPSVYWVGSSTNTHASAWRLLDLSGMTKSVRESSRLVKLGLVTVNTAKIDLKTQLPIGGTYTVEITYATGIRHSMTFHLSHPAPKGRQRMVDVTFHRKG